MKESQWKGRDLYLVRQDWLETAAEVAEVVPVLMHLDSLPIILDRSVGKKMEGKK